MTERLDRIEAILERTAQRQEQFVKQQQQFDTRQEQFDARLDRMAQEREESQRNFDARIEQLFQSFEKSREEIDLLGERIGQLAQSISELKQDRQTTWELFDRVADGMIQFQHQAAVDRAIMLENQTEIRRIWQYLLRQHPNGQGGS